MSSLEKSDLYQYQQEGVRHILGRNGSMLWLDIGLGKTIVSLTAIESLLDQYRSSGALVLAPKTVIESVWAQEAQKWGHTRRLKFSTIVGTPKQRMQALKTKADVYLINYEQIEWLVGRYVTKKYKGRDGTDKSRRVFSEGVLFEYWLNKGRRMPFDTVIFDEVSKLKTSTSLRARAFTKILPKFNFRVGLTGTPAANGLMDLHGQFLMVDGGRRLGPNITSFRNRWFTQNAFCNKWLPRRGAMAEMQKLIADITLEMKADDYIQLPPQIDQDIVVSLPAAIHNQYKKFEKDFFLSLDSGGEVEAFNSGAKSTKCRQLANGAVYVDDERTNWEVFHDEKLDAVEEVVSGLNGSPLLICYQFKHDVARLCKRFPDAVCLDGKNTAEKVARWNRGEISQLIGHPASMGHGLNLQYGGNHVLWFGLPWSLEHYEQAIGRLLRNGQKGETVVNHRIITKGTVEEAVVAALASKGATQDSLREAVKQYRLRRTA